MKKLKLFSFLSLRTYRRTFITYIAITLVLIVGVTLVLLNSALRTGLSGFSATADSTYTSISMKYDGVANSIDRLFYRIYSNPSLEEDFYQFFGSEPAEYVQSLLGRIGTGYENYPNAAHTTVMESDRCIRNILYDANDKIYNMEYNAYGYSRFTPITREDMPLLCFGRLAIKRSIASPKGGSIGDRQWLFLASRRNIVGSPVAICPDDSPKGRTEALEFEPSRRSAGGNHAFHQPPLRPFLCHGAS